MTFYKVLAADGKSPYHGGSGTWFVPAGKRAAKWMPAIKDVKLCHRGYHVTTIDKLPTWIGPTLYEAEVRGQVIAGDDKSVAEQARLVRKVDTWNDKTLRLFAADCAEHVLGLYEKAYPNDFRPRDAIRATRDFANGLIGKNAAAYAYAAYAAYAGGPVPEREVPTGKWIEATRTTIRFNAAGDTYESGFHVFPTIKAAKAWASLSEAVVKVRVRGVEVLGEQYRLGIGLQSCLVAREMYVPKPRAKKVAR